MIISSITDVEEEDNMIDTSISKTSLQTMPTDVIDGEEVELEEIYVSGGDIPEIGYVLKEKHNNIQNYAVK